MIFGVLGAVREAKKIKKFQNLSLTSTQDQKHETLLIWFDPHNKNLILFKLKLLKIEL